MKENGKMIKLTEKEFTTMQTERTTTENGKMISSMGSVWRDGQMERSMKATITKERRMEEES